MAMPELLDALTRENGSSPRRGVLRTLATLGVGAFVGGRSAPSAEAKKKGKKNKNKNKGKDRCAECASSCNYVFSGPGGQKICAETVLLPASCTPCTSHSQCLAADGQFPYCISEQEDLATGEKVSAVCEGSPPGRCMVALACAGII
jgi:hypothetical protein